MEEAEEVLVARGVLVSATVGFIVLLAMILGVSKPLTRAERVPVVVFVEVLDRVDVAVGTTGGVAAIPPIAASSKSHRMLYLFI
jgi:acetaldehyde dehydrogenase (acetylating)